MRYNERSVYYEIKKYEKKSLFNCIEILETLSYSPVCLLLSVFLGLFSYLSLGLSGACLTKGKFQKCTDTNLAMSIYTAFL